MTLITTDPQWHRIALTVYNIVHYAGHFKNDGPFWSKHYSDENNRMRLTYSVLPNPKILGAFLPTMVSVFIKARGSSDDVVWGLPAKPENDEMLVYFARQPAFQPEYYRKGRWEKYLDSLNSKFKTQAAEAEKLQRTPIDDSALFPEFDE